MEIEAKYRITEADLLVLAALDTLPGYQLRLRAGAELQRNVYYDSADRKLAAARHGLRVRSIGPRSLVTLKGPAQVDAQGVHRRVEYEFPGSSPDPATWPAGEARDQALGLLGDAALLPLVTIDTERLIRYAVRAGRDVAEISLDRGMIRAGRRTAAICELEIELLAGGSEADLAALAAAFGGLVQLTPEAQSKLQRGMALLDAAP